MKRVLLFVVGIATISPNVYAQSDAELIDQALAAAPRRARDNASVVKWSPDHTYATIKEGSNDVVCFAVGNLQYMVREEIYQFFLNCIKGFE